MNLEAIRKSKNLTQEDVAEALGVSRTTVTMWELEKAMPRFDKLLALASFLEVSMDELVRNPEQSN